ncbi:MAG: transglutaminase-like cysteine peptidase [Candidatus Peribacteraceae bacterium]|nr:transglutaminase-like cysteine peptidase [Candidatus Peribacteraceae bacterium]
MGVAAPVQAESIFQKPPQDNLDLCELEEDKFLCYTAVTIQHNLKDWFTYMTDQEQYGEPENFTSHWKELNDQESGARSFTDDCDGFALTAGDAAYSLGVSTEDITVLGINAKEGEIEGHMVLAIGEYVVDNATNTVHHWTAYGDRFDLSMKSGEGWKEFDPIKLGWSK